MTTYNTRNPLGSSDPKDLYDNAENLDIAMNSTGSTFVDRLGKTRPTLMSAIDPSGFAQSAASSADEAKAARDAAILGSAIYESVSEGLSGTENGDYFSVLSEDGETYLTLYRNEDGVAYTNEGWKYPSLMSIQGLRMSMETTEVLKNSFTVVTAGYHSFGETVGRGNQKILDISAANSIQVRASSTINSPEGLLVYLVLLSENGRVTNTERAGNDSSVIRYIRRRLGADGKVEFGFGNEFLDTSRAMGAVVYFDDAPAGAVLSVDVQSNNNSGQLNSVLNLTQSIDSKVSMSNVEEVVNSNITVTLAGFHEVGATAGRGHQTILDVSSINSIGVKASANSGSCYYILLSEKNRTTAGSVVQTSDPAYISHGEIPLDGGHVDIDTTVAAGIAFRFYDQLVGDTISIKAYSNNLNGQLSDIKRQVEHLGADFSKRTPFGTTKKLLSESFKITLPGLHEIGATVGRGNQEILDVSATNYTRVTVNAETGLCVIILYGEAGRPSVGAPSNSDPAYITEFRHNLNGTPLTVGVDTSSAIGMTIRYWNQAAGESITSSVVSVNRSGQVDKISDQIDDLKSVILSSGRFKLTGGLTMADFPPVHDITTGTHPSVLYFPHKWNGYRYWMAYTPYPDVAKENPVIVASNDGLKWLTPEGLTNPISPEPPQGYNSDTELVLTKDNTLRCYWRWYKGGGEQSVLRYMESTDGASWSALVDCNLPLDVDPLSPSIITDKLGNYAMWIGSGARGKIRKLSSSDGVAWGDLTECPSNVDDFLYHWHPMVWVEAGYFCCLSSAPSKYTDTHGSNTGNLYFGTSHDGVNWDFDVNPVFSKGQGGIHTYRVYRSCAVRVSANEFMVYISGLANTERIYVAKATLSQG